MILVGYPIWQGDLISRDVVNEVVEAEFNFIEVSIDYPWPFKNLEKLYIIVKQARDLGLRIGVHGPWRDVALASPIDEIRRASQKVYELVFDLARRIDAIYVNVHLLSKQAFYIYKSIEEELIKSAMESVGRLVDLSKTYGIDMTIENNAIGFGGSIEHLIPMVNAYKEVKVCFDIPHAISAYVKRSRGREKVNYLDLVSMWSEEFKEKLILLHIHGYRLFSMHVDDHLPLNIGDLSIKEILKRLRGTGLRYILLEVFYNEDGSPIKPLNLISSVREVKSWARTILLLGR